MVVWESIHFSRPLDEVFACGVKFISISEYDSYLEEIGLDQAKVNRQKGIEFEMTPSKST
jgi:hypothetical protein